MRDGEDVRFMCWVFLAFVVVSAAKLVWSLVVVTMWIEDMAETMAHCRSGLVDPPIQKLETALSEPEIDMSKLLDAFEQFDCWMATYISAQSDFELYLDELGAEIETSTYYCDRIRASRIPAYKFSWVLS